jgi:pimeloyl-ACP methyl ester carboxylesterase
MLFIIPLIGLVILAYCVWIFPAFRFFRKYREKVAKGDVNPHRSEVKVAGVDVHIYPSAKPSSTTLIVVTGLHPNGIYDPRFVSFAETCAQEGFQVAGLDVSDFRNFLLTKNTFNTILSVVDQLLENLQPETRKRIGVLGISYGAGPAFQIAVKHKIDFVVSIGGYFNLLHAIEYSFSGIHGAAQRPAHEWGRLIFAITHLEDLANPKDREILRRSLQLRLQLKEPDAATFEETLSSDGKILLQGILKGLSEEQMNLFRTVARRRESEAAELSPDYSLEKIDRQTAFYLLHGASDDSIPYEESIELHHAARKKGFRSRCLITEGLTHVDLTKPAAVVEFVKLLHWTRSLLREAK